MKDINYVLYARKSTEGEDKQVQSIEAQLNEMKKIAKDRNLKVITILEESKSAKAPFCRPKFNEMIKMIKRGEASGIITWQINRLSRNPSESGLLQQMLQDEQLQSIQTHDKVYSPEDNAVIFSVEASISNQFIRDLRKNVRRGIAQKAKNGGISGPAPQGYKNNREKKTIEIDQMRFPVVRSIFDMYMKGKHVSEIKRTLDAIGYTTPKTFKKSGGAIANSMIYNILKNPRYAGVIPDPFEPDLFHNAAYPAMITQEEYTAIQKRLGRKGGVRICRSKYFALKGLIKCGECGCMITAQTKFKKLIDGGVNRHTYYHCTRKRPCNQRTNVREKDMFNMVEELLNKYELSPKLYEWGMEALNDIAKKEIKARDNIQDLQFDSIKQIQSQLDNLLDLATMGAISSFKYEERSKPLEAELAKRHQEQEDVTERSRNWYEFVGRTIEELTHANEKFKNGDLIEKNNILSAIGENPILLDGNLMITSYRWLKPMENGLIEQKRLTDIVRTSNLQVESDTEMRKKSEWYPVSDALRNLHGIQEYTGINNIAGNNYE